MQPPTLPYFLLALIFQLCKGYVVLMDSYGEECFFEEVLNGTELRLTFQVLSGGFHDVDLVLGDPKGNIVFHRHQAAFGGQVFTAPQPGRYSFCFHNSYSSRVPKVIMFDFDYYEPDLFQELKKTENDLDVMVKTLGTGLQVMKREAEYLEAKTLNHFRISENSNMSILVWALLEYTIILFLCLWQRYYLLKFFEVRRYV